MICRPRFCLGVAGAASVAVFGLSANLRTLQADEVAISCRPSQTEFIAGGRMPLKISLWRGDGESGKLKLMQFFRYAFLGEQSCFKVKLIDPEGKELPIVFPKSGNPHNWTGPVTITNTRKWNASLDLNAWFRPPAGGPYKVQVYYEWTQRDEKQAPHWIGKTGVAEATFTVRKMNFGYLDTAVRKELPKLLEDLTKYGPDQKAAQDALVDMGKSALPALHDALQMSPLTQREALLPVLARIKSPESLPFIIFCPPLDSGKMFPMSMLKAKKSAIRAYGAAAAPYLAEALGKVNLEQRSLISEVTIVPLLKELKGASVEPLLKLLEGADETVPVANLSDAANVLAEIGDQRAIPVLKKLLSNNPPYASSLKRALEAIQSRQ